MVGLARIGPPIRHSYGQIAHQHDAVPVHVGGELVGMLAQVLLSPEVADALLAGQAKVGPRRPASSAGRPARLNSPTATEPSSIGLTRTNSSVVWRTMRACLPSGS